jgi:hypothetical protein
MMLRSEGPAYVGSALSLPSLPALGKGSSHGLGLELAGKCSKMRGGETWRRAGYVVLDRS